MIFSCAVWFCKNFFKIPDLSLPPCIWTEQRNVLYLYYSDKRQKGQGKFILVLHSDPGYWNPWTDVQKLQKNLDLADLCPFKGRLVDLFYSCGLSTQLKIPVWNLPFLSRAFLCQQVSAEIKTFQEI